MSSKMRALFGIVISLQAILLTAAPAYSLGFSTPLWGICGSCRYSRGGGVVATYPHYIQIPARTYAVWEPTVQSDGTVTLIYTTYSVHAYSVPDYSRPVYVPTRPVEWSIDPVGVVDFQVDFHFDQTRFTLDAIEFPDIFTSTSYDLSQVSLGIINDIRGINRLYDPVTGNGSFVGHFATVSLNPIPGTDFPQAGLDRYGNDLNLGAFYISNGDGVNGISLDPVEISPSPAPIEEINYTQIGYITDPCVEVPAPLPVLGIGVALRFSRKLRRRLTNSISRTV